MYCKYSVISRRDNGKIVHSYTGKRIMGVGDSKAMPIDSTDPMVEDIRRQHTRIMSESPNILALETSVRELKNDNI